MKEKIKIVGNPKALPSHIEAGGIIYPGIKVKIGKPAVFMCLSDPYILVIENVGNGLTFDRGWLPMFAEGDKSVSFIDAVLFLGYL